MVETRFTAASTTPAKWVIMDLDNTLASNEMDILNEKPLIWRHDVEYLATELNRVAIRQPDDITKIVEYVKGFLKRGLIDDVVSLATMHVWFDAQPPERRQAIRLAAKEASERYGDNYSRMLRGEIRVAISGDEAAIRASASSRPL